MEPEGADGRQGSGCPHRGDRLGFLRDLARRTVVPDNTYKRNRLAIAGILMVFSSLTLAGQQSMQLRGSVIDAKTGERLLTRVIPLETV